MTSQAFAAPASLGSSSTRTGLEEDTGGQQGGALRAAQEALADLVDFAVEGKNRHYTYGKKKGQRIEDLFRIAWPLVRHDTEVCSNGSVAAAFVIPSRGEDGGDSPVEVNDILFVSHTDMSSLRQVALETLSKPHLAFVRMHLPKELRGSA